MTDCNHIKIEHRYVTFYDDWEGEYRSEWQTTEIYTTVDLDTHRYQCTQCKKIMYYSSAAMAYYEDSVYDDRIISPYITGD